MGVSAAAELERLLLAESALVPVPRVHSGWAWGPWAAAEPSVVVWAVLAQGVAARGTEKREMQKHLPGR